MVANTFALLAGSDLSFIQLASSAPASYDATRRLQSSCTSTSSSFASSSLTSSQATPGSLQRGFQIGTPVGSSADSSTFLGAKLLTRVPEGRHVKERDAIVTSAGLGGMLGGIFKGGDPAEKTRQAYADKVAQINDLESKISPLSDEDLRHKTVTLKERVANGESLDSILPEAFAVVREAAKRVLGLRPFDVQLIGGMVLHKGQIAEMRTGEGKTLVAVLPAYLNALSGKGVHVVTVNDYLARRDAEWVGQVHKFLGLKVGLIQQGMDPQERRENYGCDVTYVTNSELGFDFLRDNLANSKEELVQREFTYCVIDEVDSILIDEARTPLIISGSADKPSDRYIKSCQLANALQRDVHYTVDEKQKSILLNEDGYADAEEVLGVTDLYDPREQWASYLINAIKAKELFLRDVNYIVRSKEVMIVDEFTGRVMTGRRWSDGLHQAIEAKEGVPIQNETVTLASISYQNFFLQYPKLCGMTGTAATEATEFESIYKLTVTNIPTNRSMVRKDESDVVFRSENGKWRAAVVEVARMYKTGRPVLVGTTSVEQSEALSERLREADIKHQVLNAKPENVEREAEIVAQSGRLGAVTIATNMAGRGTDIILGGNAEFMARLKLRELLLPRVVSPGDAGIAFQSKQKLPTAKSWKANPDLFPCELSETTSGLVREAVEAAVSTWGDKSLQELEAEERLSYACEKLRAAFRAVDAEYRSYTEEEKKKVIAAGGLHVIGTERHESRRIDNQLRGRSGRQGDPGSSRFFLSLEDNIFRIFGGDRIQGLMKAFRIEDLPIESKMLTRALDEAQRKVESYFFDIRKQLFEYDEVLNSQRDRVYSERRRALTADSLEGQMLEYAELTANVNDNVAKEEWPLEALAAKLKQYCYYLEDLTGEVLAGQCASYDSLRDYLQERGRQAYLLKKAEVEGKVPGLMRDAERYFVLSQTDNLWKEHLQALKFVQQAVGLRGYAQRDPLIEYKLEGYNLFLDMMANIRRNFQPMMVKKVDEEEQPAGADAAAAVPGGKSEDNAVLASASASASATATATTATKPASSGGGSRGPSSSKKATPKRGGGKRSKSIS
eukprot:jgi/Mesen1/3531/ME000197S02552